MVVCFYELCHFIIVYCKSAKETLNAKCIAKCMNNYMKRQLDQFCFMNSGVQLRGGGGHCKVICIGYPNFHVVYINNVMEFAGFNKNINEIYTMSYKFRYHTSSFHCSTLSIPMQRHGQLL